MKKYRELFQLPTTTAYGTQALPMAECLRRLNLTNLAWCFAERNIFQLTDLQAGSIGVIAQFKEEKDLIKFLKEEKKIEIKPMFIKRLWSLATN
jgi:hypothetical protein